MAVERTLTVDLGERSYPIVIGSGLLGGGFDLAEYVPGPDCLVVTNETVGPLYLERLAGCLGGRSVGTVALPDGEQHKTLATMSKVIDRLVESGAGRDTTVIALGGGVVGDIAGFAAACYMRGVRFVQVPTTLLAQVDSSVGGKTGVNHPAGKNLVGAFHQPALVLADTDTLATLPVREYRAGLAEVIKYGAIADAAFFAWLEANLDALLDKDAAAIAHAVARSCELKAEVVAEDERESGRRAILNFGHTFGHAIERCQGYGDWLHGEAVAAGMLMAARLSGLAADEQERLEALVSRAGLPVAQPGIQPAELLAAMGHDKKVLDRALRFVLLEKLGSACVTADYDEALLAHVLEPRG
ncbi:MAG: 3-dehydroquinate synthase [Woeseiaceae bacterium]|nr:3-dehydroquinate synthase [Woeseiaceae bacterium]